MGNIIIGIICLFMGILVLLVLKKMFSKQPVASTIDPIQTPTQTSLSVEPTINSSSNDWRIEVINADGSKIILYPPVQAPRI